MRRHLRKSINPRESFSLPRHSDISDDSVNAGQVVILRDLSVAIGPSLTLSPDECPVILENSDVSSRLLGKRWPDDQKWYNRLDATSMSSFTPRGHTKSLQRPINKDKTTLEGSEVDRTMPVSAHRHRKPFQKKKKRSPGDSNVFDEVLDDTVLTEPTKLKRLPGAGVSERRSNRLLRNSRNLSDPSSPGESPGQSFRRWKSVRKSSALSEAIQRFGTSESSSNYARNGTPLILSSLGLEKVEPGKEDLNITKASSEGPPKGRAITRRCPSDNEFDAIINESTQFLTSESSKSNTPLATASCLEESPNMKQFVKSTPLKGLLSSDDSLIPLDATKLTPIVKVPVLVGGNDMGSVTSSREVENKKRCGKGTKNPSSLNPRIHEMWMWLDVPPPKKVAVVAQRPQPTAPSPKKKKPARRKFQLILSDGTVYKESKLLKPRKFVTDKMYRFITRNIKDNTNLDTRVRAENFVSRLCDTYDKVLRKKNTKHLVEELLEDMVRVGLVSSYSEFYSFIEKYVPKSFRIKAIPCITDDIAPKPKKGIYEKLVYD